MRKGYVLSGVMAAVLAGGAASAAVIPTTVSATGSYNGNLAVLNDGVVPANGSSYNSADKVNFTASGNASFRFDFGGVYNVTGLLANVDNNDQYTFSAYKGDTLVGNAHIMPGDGTVGFGVETFSIDFGASFALTHFIVTASGGDSLYGIGEVQFTGTAINAVPEPATWAMMIGGFGLLGAAARRRTARAVAA